LEFEMPRRGNLSVAKKLPGENAIHPIMSQVPGIERQLHRPIEGAQRFREGSLEI
jgi:hypothetical protein